MSRLLKGKNFILRSLKIVIIVLFLCGNLNVLAQGSLGTNSEQIENFFDPNVQPLVRCIREKFKSGNTINIPISEAPEVEYTSYHDPYQFVKDRCNTGGIDDGLLGRIIACLDNSVFNNGRWEQNNGGQAEQCIAASINSRKSPRQSLLNCIFLKRYNPSTNTLDKDNTSIDSFARAECSQEMNEAFAFPINQKYQDVFFQCLDPNIGKPVILDTSWRWDSGNDRWQTGLNAPTNQINCRWFFIDLLGLRLPTKSTHSQTGLPDLNFNPIIIDIPTEQTCWISKEDKNAGPNLTNIWNPGNWLPIMYKCQNTTPDGRPIPLHPINLIPIAIRLFAFITSLLIWLIILNLVIGIILFIVGVATSILAWVKKILIGSVAVVIVLIFMYFILYFILSIFQG